VAFCVVEVSALETGKRTGATRAIGRPSPGGTSPNGHCAALTKAGEPCKGRPLPGLSVCISHSEAHRDGLREAGRKGGRVAGRGRARSGASELRELRSRLADLADAVEAEEISPAVAHAIAALGNVRIRAVEVERKLREVEELATRLEALEAGERWR
jgi:hypothetical protein